MFADLQLVWFPFRLNQERLDDFSTATGGLGESGASDSAPRLPQAPGPNPEEAAATEDPCEFGSVLGRGFPMQQNPAHRGGFHKPVPQFRSDVLGTKGLHAKILRTKGVSHKPKMAVGQKWVSILEPYQLEPMTKTCGPLVL